MSYRRFMLKCFFTFVVFPLVFCLPFATAPLWEVSAQIVLFSARSGMNVLSRDFQSYIPDAMQTYVVNFWPVFLFWFLAFIIWATLTYLMWFRVPNRPRK